MANCEIFIYGLFYNVPKIFSCKYTCYNRIEWDVKKCKYGFVFVPNIVQFERIKKIEIVHTNITGKA